MKLIPPTDKLEEDGSDALNLEIENGTFAQLAKVMSMQPEEIDHRLEELDREWDIEKILGINAAAVSLFGLTLGFTKSRKWFALPVVVAGFLLEQALQGWSPPIPLLRSLGLRTADEINAERMTLRLMRGDFSPMDVFQMAEDGDGIGDLGDLQIL